MKIEVYGSGCPKCKKTFENAKEAVKQAGVEAEVVAVFNVAEVVKKGISKTPAVLIDNQLKIGGRIAEIEEIKELLSK